MAGRKRIRKPRQVRRGPESSVQDDIRTLLTLKYKWRTWRNNVHEGRMQFGGYIKCGTKGQADITCLIPHGCMGLFFVLHVETKSKDGRQSHEQKLWQQLVEANGEYYMLARSQGEVEDYLGMRGWAK